MNNIKIAKQLIKLAKSLTAFDQRDEEDIINNAFQFINNKTSLKKYTPNIHIGNMKKIMIEDIIKGIKIGVNIQYEYENQYNNIFISEFKDEGAMDFAYYCDQALCLKNVMEEKLLIKQEDYINKLNEIIKPFKRKLNNLQSDLLNKVIYFTDYQDLFYKLDDLLNSIENYFEQKNLIQKQVKSKMDIQCKKFQDQYIKLQREEEALDIEQDMDKDQFDREIKDLKEREDAMEERWMRNYGSQQRLRQYEQRKKPYMTDRRMRRLNNPKYFEEEEL